MTRTFRLSPLLTVPALDADEVSAVPTGTYVLAQVYGGRWVRAAMLRHRDEHWHQVYVTHEWIRGGWITLDRAREQVVRSDDVVAYHCSLTATAIYGFLSESSMRGQE